MKIKRAVGNLKNLEMGFYKLSDKDYWSKELNEKFHSQSYWKKIGRESIKAILAGKEKNNITKDMRLGLAGHYLILEGEEKFNQKVFIKKEFPQAPNKGEYIERKIKECIFNIDIDPDNPIVKKTEFFAQRLAEANLKPRKEMPNKTEFLQKKLKRVKEPQKIPTQSEFIKDAKTPAQKNRLKERHKKLKEKFKIDKDKYNQSKKKATEEFIVLQKEARKVIEYNKKIEDEITIEWNRYERIINQLGNEWSEGKARLDQAKKNYKEDLEDAQEEKLIILNDIELENVLMTCRSFFSHALARKLHKKSEKEIAGLVYHPKSKLYLKVKFDLIDFHNGVIADLKLLDEVDDESFFWNSEKRLFKIQFAIYTWAAEALGLKINKFVAITCSKKAEETVFRNLPMDKIKGEWLDLAEELLCQYAEELEDFNEGKTRYDNEVEYFDPREALNEDIDEIFGELVS